MAELPTTIVIGGTEEPIIVERHRYGWRATTRYHKALGKTRRDAVFALVKQAEDGRCPYVSPGTAPEEAIQHLRWVYRHGGPAETAERINYWIRRYGGAEIDEGDEDGRLLWADWMARIEAEREAVPPEAKEARRRAIEAAWDGDPEDMPW